jgi:hypothetical protein
VFFFLFFWPVLSPVAIYAQASYCLDVMHLRLHAISGWAAVMERFEATRLGMSMMVVQPAVCIERKSQFSHGSSLQ